MSLGNPQYLRLAKGPANDLERQWQAATGKAAGHRNRWQTGHVGRGRQSDERRYYRLLVAAAPIDRLLIAAGGGRGERTSRPWSWTQITLGRTQAWRSHTHRTGVIFLG